jgi:trehalose transport system permease protein
MKLRVVMALSCCMVFLAFLLFPLYIMLKMSISSPQEVFQERPPYGIQQVTWQHFARVFDSGEVFYGPLRRSAGTAAWVTLFALLLSVPAAYGAAHLPVRVRYGLLFLMFAGRMVPEVSLALPIAVRFIRWGLFDSMAGLVMAHLIRVLPVSCFILVSVFSAFPRDLEEQASIDGCSRLGAIGRIVLPLSLPGIAVAALFAFLLSWDEFIYASYLTLARPTMPLQVYYYISRGSLFHAATYAVIITVPVLVVTFLLQRHIRPELMAGGLKG